MRIRRIDPADVLADNAELRERWRGVARSMAEDDAIYGQAYLMIDRHPWRTFLRRVALTAVILVLAGAMVVVAWSCLPSASGFAPPTLIPPYESSPRP